MRVHDLKQLSSVFSEECLVNAFIEKQLSANNIRTEFPSAIAEAKAAYAQTCIETPNRKDLRETRCLTIDCRETKDMDDAVGIIRTLTGYRLFVHIADVAEYVQHESPLEAEAIIRGSSIYLPGRTIPMLPQYLTNDLCSLAPNVDRLAITVDALLDAEGKINCVSQD